MFDARADHGEWVESIAAALEAAAISTVPQLMEYQRTDEALAGCATPVHKSNAELGFV